MSQYTLETIMNMLQFSLQNFSENQQLILKLLLLLRDEIQSCTGRKSVYRYRLVHQFYTEYKYYYTALSYVTQALREPDDPSDKIQSVVQEVINHSVVGELTLSQRELGTQANNRLLFVSAVERLIEKDPVFERLRPWL